MTRRRRVPEDWAEFFGIVPNDPDHHLAMTFLFRCVADAQSGNASAQRYLRSDDFRDWCELLGLEADYVLRLHNRSMNGK